MNNESVLGSRFGIQRLQRLDTVSFIDQDSQYPNPTKPEMNIED